MPQLKPPLGEALVASAVVTVAVGFVTAVAPTSWHAALVAVVFLGATWALVWRGDDERVQRSGLSLGGLMIPGTPSVGAVAREGAVACAWGLAVLALVAVPFYFGWRLWWERSTPRLSFALAVTPAQAGDELLGQLFVVALPEEAFYRGYLQSRFDELWPPRWSVLGARLGPGLFAAAGIFALGHVVTVARPARLAVFFPALVFGWLRERTGGVGASVFFHAFCNVYSQALGRGYGVY